MGKPTTGCFKIITCAGEQPDHQQPSEGKGSIGRGWSFRKRSARHRTLSNTVISEEPPSANKGSPELFAADSQVQPNLTGSEKTSFVQCHEETSKVSEEKNEVSDQPDPKISDNVAPTKDASLDDSSILILQAAIRRSLAQKYLLKQKSIVKLQAVVRGHIVRKQAVGTLRCVQAIVKMQVLFRARHGRRSGKFNLDPTPLSKGETKPQGTYSYISVEQLLKNKFARQLLESTSRTKPINIKCDPLKSDSTWKWLERWMSVSSVRNEELQESKSVSVHHEKETFEYPEGKKEILVPSESYSESTEITSRDGSLAAASEDDEDTITYDAKNMEPDACKLTAPASSSSHPQLQNVHESNLGYDTTGSAPIETIEIDQILDPKAETLPKKEEPRSDHEIPDLKKYSAEQPESEAKGFSRRVSNPSFVAAQSKFEELSSAGSSVKLADLSRQDPGVGSSFNESSSPTDQPMGSREIGLVDSYIANASAVHIGGSECGTVLSVSSTLDSPDGTKIEGDNPEHNARKSSFLETDPLYINTSHSGTGESITSLKPEAHPSDVHLDLESEATLPAAEKSSSLASPRSLITVPGSQETPSSLFSVKPSKGRGEKSKSNQKSKSSSGNKTSRIPLEQRQDKNGKRRNSFGSPKPSDNAVLEPKGSRSSNSLPSYMQATESARAKAIANNSPRASPDVHEKDVFIKKRHSLPGTDGRQGSPRMQRSLSQTHAKAKGSDTHSLLDRKWQR